MASPAESVDPLPGPDQERPTNRLYTEEHHRSTFTPEETRLVQFVRYTKFSCFCWLVYMIPATIALIIGLCIDRDTYSACDQYLRFWAIAQTTLQVLNIISKSLTLVVVFRLPVAPEPDEIEEFKQSRSVVILAWFNRLFYFIWIGLFSCGALWSFEVFFDLYNCHTGMLFDIILTLIVIQLLFVAMLCFLFCGSTCLLCIRIVQILVRLSRQQDEGLFGLVQPVGATDDLIHTCTTKKEFKEDLLEKNNAMCAICLEDYNEGDEVRFLPCTDLHHFHVECVDQWLKKKKCCPLCKVNIDTKTVDGEDGAEELQTLSPDREVL